MSDGPTTEQVKEIRSKLGVSLIEAKKIAEIDYRQRLVTRIAEQIEVMNPANQSKQILAELLSLVRRLL